MGIEVKWNRSAWEEEERKAKEEVIGDCESRFHRERAVIEVVVIVHRTPIKVG